MSGTEQTFHYTKEDVRRMEQKESAAHSGNIPADSPVAALQSIVDKADKDKSEVIAERRANLPLPEQPPTASDFNSADANVGSGSGSLSGDVEAGGRQGKDGLGGVPDDAVTRDAKGKAGTVDTTNADKGYPKNNDPSSGL